MLRFGASYIRYLTVSSVHTYTAFADWKLMPCLQPLVYMNCTQHNGTIRWSGGYDEVTAGIIKLSLPVINGPLTHILNLSLLEGVFPSELKVANVLPLYKADDDMLFNNYRPVSLLSVLSKVFERIMYDRLISFLENKKILFKNQFGFRKQHSTYMALMLKHWRMGNL